MNEITWPIVVLAVALAGLWFKVFLELREVVKTFLMCASALKRLENRIADLEKKR